MARPRTTRAFRPSDTTQSQTMNKTAVMTVLVVAGIGAVAYSLWRSEPPAGVVPGATQVSPAPSMPITNHEPAVPATQMATNAPAREQAPQNVTEQINDG